MADQLGTPRMIFDKTGSLAATKRHDYLPFGEELFAGTGARTTALGYTGGDGVRQQFTSNERDNETGLDYFLARYYSSTQGRFFSADSYGGSRFDPQSLNRYSYVLNNPLGLIDASGHMPERRYYGLCGPSCQDPKDPQVIKRPFVLINDPKADPTGDILDGPIIVRGDTLPITTGDPVLATLPSSYLDYLPVAGSGREFLFNYKTHNFEGALVVLENWLLSFHRLEQEVGVPNLHP